MLSRAAGRTAAEAGCTRAPGGIPSKSADPEALHLSIQKNKMAEVLIGLFFNTASASQGPWSWGWGVGWEVRTLDRAQKLLKGLH